jgi:excinuclease ABC subunit C
MHFTHADYPETPGVYLMKDAGGRILYVGKAKSLRKRLASYFRPGADHAPKTIALLAKVERIDILLVSTEKEALLLEESLIKKHRPRYNIVLRDDKRSLLFRLDKNAPFPKLTLTRRVVRDGSVYFGPFTSAQAARQTQKLLAAIFPLRKCADHVFKNRVRPCLYHQLKQCLAPCVGLVDKERYGELVKQTEQFLAGKSHTVVKFMRKAMLAASEAMEYERAARLRDQLSAIERTMESQAAVLHDALDRDVIAVVPTSEGLGVGILYLRGGLMLEQKTYHWDGLGTAETAEALESFLAQFYGEGQFIPGRVVVSEPFDTAGLGEVLTERRGGLVRLGLPRGDDERRLVEMARDLALTANRSPDAPDIPALLERALNLSRLPLRVECVDITHHGGKGVRAGLVVYEEGQRSKEASRVYALPELEHTADDYAALARFTQRRLESGEPWPDLLLIDGGRGQLGVVERVLNEAGLGDLFELASIAKGPTRRAGELEDRVFRPGRKNPVTLRPGSQELLFLQRVRDATHRFIIGKGRAVNRKSALAGTLVAIPGLGPALAKRLFDTFGSVAGLKKASAEDIAQVRGIGPGLAERIRDHLQKQ